MRLLHFADLHLDAPFAWARPETARLRRRNRRETLTRILQLADDEGVDAILCAGDLFEHERFTPDTVAFLRESFAGPIGRSTSPRATMTGTRRAARMRWSSGARTSISSPRIG